MITPLGESLKHSVHGEPGGTCRLSSTRPSRFGKVPTLGLDEALSCSKVKNPGVELGCTLQTVVLEGSQRGASAIEKYGELKQHQMALKARVRGQLALVSSTRGYKRMDFANQDSNAAINIRKCLVPEKRPAELTRANFVGQTLLLEVYKEKLKPIAGGRSKNTGRRLRVGRYIYTPWS